MMALVEQQLHGLTGLLIGVVHQLEFLRAHVVVVQPVDDQGGALNLIRVKCIVPVNPVRAVIAVQGQLIHADLVEVVAIVLLDGRPIGVIQVAARAVPGQVIGVGGVTAGRNALRVGVLIPAGDAGHRDNGLQALHAGSSQTKLGGTGIGTAGHTHLAVGPVGLNGNVPGLVGVGHPVTGKPLDHAFERIDLQVGSAGLKAVGALGAQTAALHHGKAPDQIVVIPGQVFVVVHTLIGIPVVPVVSVGGRHGLGSGGGTCGYAGRRLAVHGLQVIGPVAIRGRAGGTAGDVGTGLIDGGEATVAVYSLPGNLDQGLYQVQLSISVGIVVGLHIHTVADRTGPVHIVVLGGVGILEDGLGHSVHEQRLFPVRIVQRVIEDAGLLQHVLQLGLRTQLSGIVALGVLIHHAHTVGHGDIVPGILAQLALFHAGPSQQCGDDLLLRQALFPAAGLDAVIHVIAAQAGLQRLAGNDGVRVRLSFRSQGRKRQRPEHRAGR